MQIQEEKIGGQEWRTKWIITSRYELPTNWLTGLNTCYFFQS